MAVGTMFILSGLLVSGVGSVDYEVGLQHDWKVAWCRCSAGGTVGADAACEWSEGCARSWLVASHIGQSKSPCDCENGLVQGLLSKWARSMDPAAGMAACGGSPDRVAVRLAPGGP